MKQGMWSGRTLLKYCLIQLPGIVLFILLIVFVRRWIPIASWLMWLLIGVWIIKDIILYPFVWRSYEWRSLEENHAMTGLCGVAKDRLDPSGHVFIRGERWKARLIEDVPAVEKGENVIVQGVKGLTLLVKPEKWR